MIPWVAETGSGREIAHSDPFLTISAWVVDGWIVQATLLALNGQAVMEWHSTGEEVREVAG
jgi:hypothetical protein